MNHDIIDNRKEKLEQLAEGYRRLDLVAEAAEAEAYSSPSDQRSGRNPS
jgi:hypothetical protein